MAVVVVQVGQCGNQLGDELFTQLSIAVASARKCDPSTETPFFCDDGMARCVLIDSEPKVVHGVRARHETFIRPENVVCGQSGRGNNWGMGYNGVRDDPRPNLAAVARTSSGTTTTTTASEQRQQHRRDGGGTRARHPPQGFQKVYKQQRLADEQLLTRALRAIHRETRRTAECPAGFEAILLLHSLSGGTGSGLASRLAEKIHFYFVEPPHGCLIDERREASMMIADGLDGMLVEKRRAKYLVDVAVAPQGCGELSLQGINAALTLATMHRYADATILLRNDDVMAPSGSVTRGTTTSTNVLQRCFTFKEANEVLVALLLPVLRYGVMVGSARCSDGGRGWHSRRRRGPSSHCRSSGGAVATITRNCTPVGDAARVLASTGGNTILTLLPTPQNTYESLRRAVLRCVFFPVLGGKDLLPGCSASLPLETICARSALAELSRRNGSSHSKSLRTSSDAPLYGRRARDGRVSEDRPPWDAGVEERSGRRAPSRWDNGCDEEDDGADERSEDNRDDGVVYTEVAVTPPPKLLAYYAELQRSPVAALARQLEGVAVLNQARELNRALLFPLLKSAAMKVSVGAFMETYAKAGVAPEDIVKAYQCVAEFLSYAEEL